MEETLAVNGVHAVALRTLGIAVFSSVLNMDTVKFVIIVVTV